MVLSSDGTCALVSGGAKCWGNNIYGQVGDGTTTQRRIPTNVSGLTSNVGFIRAMGDTTCAIANFDAVTKLGDAKCWGDSTYGQLGDGTSPYRLSPVDVAFSLTSTTVSYTYNTTHKHAVASLSTGESYQYDANGNMTSRTEGGKTYTQTFNAENRMVSVTVDNQTTEFVYDGDGNMVKQVNADGSKTLFVSGSYQEVRTSANVLTEWRVYYPAGGAMRVNGTLYYALTDHLGSTTAVTDASGNIVNEQRYMPYGQPRLANGGALTDRLFTGQRNIASLGLMDYKARFYSPSLGRFIQPDTIVPDQTSPQAFNRFSYVKNNPINFNDPTGHFECNNIYGCTGPSDESDPDVVGGGKIDKDNTYDLLTPSDVFTKYIVKGDLAPITLYGGDYLSGCDQVDPEKCTVFYNVYLSPGENSYQGEYMRMLYEALHGTPSWNIGQTLDFMGYIPYAGEYVAPVGTVFSMTEDAQSKSNYTFYRTALAVYSQNEGDGMFIRVAENLFTHTGYDYSGNNVVKVIIFEADNIQSSPLVTQTYIGTEGYFPGTRATISWIEKHLP
jgi:RHS repeat-associated protein